MQLFLVMKRHFAGTFLKFSAAGIVNTLVGLAVIYACKFFLGLNDVAANATGYIVGIIVSFALNSRWVFGFRGGQWLAFGKFLLVILCAYAINLVVVLAAIRGLSANAYLGQALGVAPYALFTYLASRFFVFRPAHNAVAGGESA